MKKPLIIVCGLSGTGKSHASRRLVEALGYIHSNPEIVRHELDIQRYSRKDTPKVLARMVEDIENFVREGKGVVVDANLKTNDTRQMFYDTAHTLGIPTVIIECVASEEAAKKRISERDDLIGSANHPRDPRVFDAQKGLWQDIALDFTLQENSDVAWIRYDSEAQTVTILRPGVAETRGIQSVLLS